MRIEQIQETFIVAEKNDEVIGYINGPVIKERYISDDLFKNVSTNNSEGGYISVLGLVVAPNYQGQGIAGRLLNYFENLAKNQHRHGVTLTCRESLIFFMKNMGIVMKVYQNHVMAVLNGITLLKYKKDDEV